MERPLVTSKGEGKSYIYSNYNPKYAQYAVTILRTFYNFYFPQENSKEDAIDLVMKLGLADNIYDCKDILYFS